MNFRVQGLVAQSFEHLYGMPEHVPNALGIVYANLTGDDSHLNMPNFLPSKLGNQETPDY